MLHEPLRVVLDTASATPEVEFHLDAREAAKYNAVIGFRLQPGAPAAALQQAGEKVNGMSSDTILKLPLRLRITRVDNGAVLMDTTVEQAALENSNRSERNFTVDQIRLERGEYKVHMFVLRGFDWPKGVDASFAIYVRRL